MTALCTGLTANTKIDSTLCVTPERQGRQVYQKVNIEGVLITIRCRFTPYRMTVATPTWEQVVDPTGWHKPIDRKVYKRLNCEGINTNPMMNKH